MAAAEVATRIAARVVRASMVFSCEWLETWN
jgi:hypothetical protein